MGEGLETTTLTMKHASFYFTTVCTIWAVVCAPASSQDASHFRRADIPRNEHRLLALAGVREFRCDYELARFAQGSLLIAELFRDGKCIQRFRLARAKHDQSKKDKTGTLSIGWQGDAHTLVSVHDTGDSHGPWTGSIHLDSFIPEDACYFAESLPERRKSEGTGVDVELYPVLGLCGQRTHQIHYPEAGDAQAFLKSCTSAGARDAVVIYLYSSPLDEEPALKFAAGAAKVPTFGVRAVDAPLADIKTAIEKVAPDSAGRFLMPTANQPSWNLTSICGIAPGEFLAMIPRLPARAVSDVLTEDSPVRITNVTTDGTMIHFDVESRFEDGRRITNSFSTQPSQGMCVALPDSKRPEGYRVFVVFPDAVPKPPLTKETVIEIARAYVKKETPDIDISQRPPTAEFHPHAPAHGGSIWTVGFAIPAPKDPTTGKLIGVRPFISLAVWVRPDGTIEGSASHTP